ncbi:hypothetical protein JXA02_13215 [candidate division KSB1 bacterium]|nr:hypothetical protein [candidate division KSB1 bacterium]RQW01494.1 MAG: hypothetical protein EH222_15080 [candidate division KSB1 bacterium]
MVKEQAKYIRKLSGEEALKRYILVVRESLKLFPSPGTMFTLKIGDKKIEAEVTLIEVWNQGGSKPSTEYHIDLSHHPDVFRPHYGQKVTLTRKKDTLYELN